MAPGLALAMICLSATTGCGLVGDDDSDASGTPRAGGSAVFLLPGEPRGLDPFSASYPNVADGNRMSALYDVLVWTEPATGTVHPKLAESLTSDAQYTNWTLTLRAGLRFSDGSVLDAAAVKATWDAHRDPTVNSLVGGVLRDVRLILLSDLQLRIELPSANANFDHMVARNLAFVAPTKFVSTPEGRAALKRTPIGAGPFKLTAWEPGKDLRMVRNENYWQKGLPHLDELVFRVDRNIAAAPESIAKSRADITVTTDPTVLGDARDKDLTVDETLLNGGLMIAFNLRKPPFDNADARRAIALALSGEELNRRFYKGLGVQARGIFNASSPLANVNLAAVENKPPQAGELFAKLTSNGQKPFVFHYLVPDSPKSRDIAEYIRRTLAGYPGVTMIVDVVDIASLVTRTSAKHDFEATVFQLWADDVEPSMHQFLITGGINNITGYSNSAVDKALGEGRLSPDPKVRRDAYTRVQTALNRDMPFWVYLEASAAAVHSRHITGVEPFNDGLVHFDRITRNTAD
ncbi:ABC transporter substrate-binding protein [Embleya sp. NPDC050493]|uniref:ABC transporter substrate-binding protein n=1 Tax=Embleya sp. NPDC050493 TaxID=3363989 RepID=UPI0037951F32